MKHFAVLKARECYLKDQLRHRTYVAFSICSVIQTAQKFAHKGMDNFENTTVIQFRANDNYLQLVSIICF